MKLVITVMIFRRTEVGHHMTTSKFPDTQKALMIKLGQEVELLCALSQPCSLSWHTPVKQ